MNLFRLPDELIFSALCQQFPCRDPQIRALATLLHPSAAPCPNLVLHGTEATGKTAITSALLSKLSSSLDNQDEKEGPTLRYAIINSLECITARHLYETAVAKVAAALEWDLSSSGRCESVSQLTVELCKMLKYPSRPDGFRFVLVFDGIDRQREAPGTLLPGLARLSEIIPRLTTLFIVTTPPPSLHLHPPIPHIYFPPYSKPDYVTILSATKPPPPSPTTSPSDTADLWMRFIGAVYDSLAKAACRTLPALKHACETLWPRFTAPIAQGIYGAREFSKLLVAGRVLFQDENVLEPGVVSLPPAGSSKPSLPSNPNPSFITAGPLSPVKKPPQPSATLKGTTTADLATLLPPTARLLLLASYLASHNPSRYDITLFSTHYHGRKRRLGGPKLKSSTPGQRSKHRKISRKLLGAHAFVLERMLAIYAAVRSEWDPKFNLREGDEVVALTGDVDVGMALATLASLRLLVKVGGAGGGGSAAMGGIGLSGGGGLVPADVMDRGGKWRVNVGWEFVRRVGRSLGVEVEEWLVE